MTSNTEMVTISRAEYEAMQAKLEAKCAELADAMQKNRWLLEQLHLNKKKLFGTSSEQLDQMVMDQFAHLFNEAEGWDRASYEPAPKVKSHTRKRRTGNVEDVIPEGTPVEVVEHHLPEEECICAVCGTEMVKIGKEVRRTLQMEPARFWGREDRYYTYACKNCEQDSGEAVVECASREPSVLPGGFASPSAIAHIATQKYVRYSPLYRLEQEFERMGLKLTRQTMPNWLLHAAEDWLNPIYDVLHRQLCQHQVLHGDETTLQVLREKDKAATSKSYMWLYRTSGDAEHPIVLYEYQPNRKAEHAERFLKGFSGWLHADGYQGYHKLLSQIRVVGCWAHARRKFDEALNTVPKEQQQTSKPAEALCYFARLFRMEQEFAELPAEERYAKRLELVSIGILYHLSSGHLCSEPRSFNILAGVLHRRSRAASRPYFSSTSSLTSLRSGVRSTGSWASEATSPASPRLSIQSAVRPARPPKSPSRLPLLTCKSSLSPTISRRHPGSRWTKSYLSGWAKIT